MMLRLRVTAVVTRESRNVMNSVGEHVMRRMPRGQILNASIVPRGLVAMQRCLYYQVLIASILVLATIPSYANAQQPGTPAYNSVFLLGHGAGDTRHRGRDNWGAVAFSRDTTVSAVTGMRTRREAEEKALQLCHERGGERCDVKSFANGCMAFAESETRMGSRMDHPRKTSAEYRREQALKNCGAGCKITWEGCALD